MQMLSVVRQMTNVVSELCLTPHFAVSHFPPVMSLSGALFSGLAFSVLCLQFWWWCRIFILAFQSSLRIERQRWVWHFREWQV